MNIFKSKTKIYLLIAIVVIGAGILGYVVMQASKDGVSPPSVLSWNVYIDEENGFNFEYPENWEVVRSDSELLVGDPANEKFEIKILNKSGSLQDFGIKQTRLTYQIDSSRVPDGERNFMGEGVRSLMTKRLKKLGLEEILVSREGNEYLVLTYENTQDDAFLTQTIKKTPSFEFQEVKGQYRDVTDFHTVELDDLFQKTSLTGIYLVSAELDLNPPTVDLTFNETGKEMLQELTKHNVGLPLAVVVDGRIVAAPTIEEPITGDTVRLVGVLNPGEALEVASQLKVMIFSPTISVLSEISCEGAGEESVRRCKGNIWSEDGKQVLDIMPNQYVEIEKRDGNNIHVLSVISDPKDSFEMEVFNHIVSSFRFEDINGGEDN